MQATFAAPRGLGGSLVPPPDKSITHRALMLGAVAEGVSRVSNPLRTGDCLSTAACLGRLGVRIVESSEGPLTLVIHGVGLQGFREPEELLDAENSGTTIRLLSGLLAGLPLFAVLTGDASLRRRPMLRVVEPLRKIAGTDEGVIIVDNEPIFNLPGVKIMAKSGTADPGRVWLDLNGDGQRSRNEIQSYGDHAWTIVLVQRSDSARPDFAVAVLVEFGGSGAACAGPVANQVLHALRAEGYL